MNGPDDPDRDSSVQRLAIVVKGRVQGVGYRFFTRECAQALGLSGWVRNLRNGDVGIEAQGPAERLQSFTRQLERGPSLGYVTGLQTRQIPPVEGESGFGIRS